MLKFEPPITLDGEEARQQLVQELLKSKYQPTAQDWMGDIAEWFYSLFDNIPLPTEGGAGILSAIGLIVIIGALIFALYKFGAPRLARHRRGETDSMLFGEAEERTAKELRDAAKKAANSKDWITAVTLQFRAMARRMQERTILDHVPSLTSQSFSAQLAQNFPNQATELNTAANSFDEVRYLLRPGTAEDYHQIATLDGTIERLKPAQLAEIGGDAF